MRQQSAVQAAGAHPALLHRMDLRQYRHWHWSRSAQRCRSQRSQHQPASVVATHPGPQGAAGWAQPSRRPAAGAPCAGQPLHPAHQRQRELAHAVGSSGDASDGSGVDGERANAAVAVAGRDSLVSQHTGDATLKRVRPGVHAIVEVGRAGKSHRQRIHVGGGEGRLGRLGWGLVKAARGPGEGDPRLLAAAGCQPAVGAGLRGEKVGGGQAAGGG